MTQEQYNKLIKYEQIFKSAIDSKYMRAIDSRFAADFNQACKELNIYLRPGCPACLLRAAQTLGKLYFDFKQQIPDNRETPSSDSPDSVDSPDSAELPKLDSFKPDSSILIKPNKTISKQNKVSQKSPKQAKKKTK